MDLIAIESNVHALTTCPLCSCCRCSCWRIRWRQRPPPVWRLRPACTSCCCRTGTCCSTWRCWCSSWRSWRPVPQRWHNQSRPSRSLKRTDTVSYWGGDVGAVKPLVPTRDRSGSLPISAALLGSLSPVCSGGWCRHAWHTPWSLTDFLSATISVVLDGAEPQFPGSEVLFLLCHLGMFQMNTSLFVCNETKILSARKQIEQIVDAYF